MAKGGTVLKATIREARGTAAARRLRNEGWVPAVVYGHQQGTVAVSLPQKELVAAIRSGARTLGLLIEGKEQQTLIKETQFDPISLDLLHVDFARVALDEKVTVSVPIVTSGTPKGSAEGGVLDLVRKDVEVECLVTNIPGEIRVKVADLAIGDAVLVQDLELPEGVVLAPDVERDATVVTVHAPRKEAEEVVAPEAVEVESTEPEVISEKEREERAEAKEKEEEEEGKEKEKDKEKKE